MAEATGFQSSISLKPFTTLKAGGEAEQFICVRNLRQLEEAAVWSQMTGGACTLIGWGSNILPSDDGVPGLSILNRTRSIQIQPNGLVLADSGCGFQELFLKTAQAGLRGLEFAVGIPGTLGGALVSNAGAYRSSVSEFLTRIEIVSRGVRKWVDPSWMEFSYRDSVLRRDDKTKAVLLQIEMHLPVGEPKKIYDEAREYQRQRIGKQPPSPRRGSPHSNCSTRSLA